MRRRFLCRGPGVWVAPGMKRSAPSGMMLENVGMLVLSRKKNESIVIDDNIVITIVEIRGDKVRLGIQAPKEVPVHRSEVYAAIHSEQAKKEPPAVSSTDS